MSSFIDQHPPYNSRNMSKELSTFGFDSYMYKSSNTQTKSNSKVKQKPSKFLSHANRNIEKGKEVKIEAKHLALLFFL